MKKSANKIKLVKTAALPKDARIVNAKIDSVDISYKPLHCNSVVLDVRLVGEDGIRFVFPRQNLAMHTESIGYILKALMETALMEEDVRDNRASYYIGNMLRMMPIRVAYLNDGCKLVAIGNFMENKWLLVDDVENLIAGFIKERNAK